MIENASHISGIFPVATTSNALPEANKTCPLGLPQADIGDVTGLPLAGHPQVATRIPILHVTIPEVTPYLLHLPALTASSNPHMGCQWGVMTMTQSLLFGTVDSVGSVYVYMHAVCTCVLLCDVWAFTHVCPVYTELRRYPYRCPEQLS